MQGEGLSESHGKRSGGSGQMVEHPRGVKRDPNTVVAAKTAKAAWHGPRGWGWPGGHVSQGHPPSCPQPVCAAPIAAGVMCMGRYGARMAHGGDHFLRGLVPVALICPQ